MASPWRAPAIAPNAIGLDVTNDLVQLASERSLLPAKTEPWDNFSSPALLHLGG